MIKRGDLLVPLHHSALDAAEGKADCRVPGLGLLLDEVVDRVADLCVGADVGIREVVCSRDSQVRFCQLKVMCGGELAKARTCCRVVLVVVLELLGGDGLAEVEAEGVEDVILGGREGCRLGQVGTGERGRHSCACLCL